MPGYASVVLLHSSFVHRDRLFTYSVPDDLDVGVGSIVRVPFARSRTTGVVTQMLRNPDVDRTLPIIATLGPGLGSESVSLARWTTDRYLSTFGEALAAAAPERIAAVERSAAAAAVMPKPALPVLSGDPLRGWRGAGALARSIMRGGHAAFSLQPPAATDRGPLLVHLSVAALTAGRGVLILLPEVRFRGEVATALDAALGEQIAWLGTDRSTRDRYSAWLALRGGRKHIACGGRGAAFAPVENLGLVVVDDESHVSYKERRAPRFHARTVAAERARRAGAALVAVGVPPSVEVAAAVASGRMTAVAPPRRAQTDRRVPVTIADLSREPERLVPTGRTLSAAKRALTESRRVVILTHRGGEEAARIYARALRTLKPRAPARLDARSAQADLRRAVAKADLIVATPVIAKDLPPGPLGLVAICHADAALSHADFRTPEEAFSTWWRIARYADAVVVETAQPQHPAIRALVRFDPSLLVAVEIDRRRSLGYPPFAGLARITAPAGSIDRIAQDVEQAGGTVLGPVVRASREGGEVRDSESVIGVRASSPKALEQILAPLALRWRDSGDDARIDIDPRELLP